MKEKCQHTLENGGHQAMSVKILQSHVTLKFRSYFSLKLLSKSINPPFSFLKYYYGTDNH